MEALEKKLNLILKESELCVQPLAFKSVSFLEDCIGLLESDVRNKPPDYGSRISFIWSFQVKDLAITLRNSLVNLLKLEQFAKDGIKSEADVEEYKNKLSIVFDQAADDVNQSYQNCLSRNDELNTEWQHQFNPAPTIVKQVKTIVDQIKMIQRSQHKLDKVNEKFNDFRSSYLDHMDQRVDKLTEIMSTLTKLKSDIDSESEALSRNDLNKIDLSIISATQKIEKNNSYSPYEYITLEDTDKLNLAVDTDGGQLIYKTIDILSEVTGWTSFNLASPLKGVDSKLQGFVGRVIANLVQLSNKIKAKLESSSDDDLTYSRSNLTSPLVKLISEYNSEIEVTEIEKISELKTAINENIVGSQLFNNEYNFLPSSALGQLTGFAEKSELQRRYNPNRIKKMFSNYTQNLFYNYSKRANITAGSYINNILDFDTESDANALFLRQGFLGTSFSIDRPEIMTKVESHYDLWLQGYGGAIAIVGSSLSGKSTILEKLPINHPDMTSYHLIPGQKIDVKGYKRTMTENLVETLRFILKHKGNDKCILTIDNLEHYVDNPAEAFDLMYDLNSIISRHTKNVYFAVVMHKYLYQKFAGYFNLSNIFTDNIFTDSTPLDLIENAVLTRAHAVVNNADNEVMSSQARKVARASNENIGKAMQLWCLNKNPDYEENLNHSNFKKLVKLHKPLLKNLLMFGMLNQPKLLKMFNEVDARNLIYDIDSLIRLRLLVRPREAAIAINPYLKTYVEDHIQ